MEKSVEVNRAFYETHWARRWKARFMYDPVSKRKIALRCLRRGDAWPAGKRVLDIGFGFGLILFALDRSNKIAGIELASTAVEQAKQLAAKKGYEGARFLEYSGTGPLPLEDASFDLILCSHVLEHVPDDRFLLGEIKRLLAPDGKVFLNVPINEEHFNDPNHVRKYTTDGFVRLLAESGFELRQRWEEDKLWDWFGGFFEKGRHDWPLIGFPLSSAINITMSTMPSWMGRGLEKLLWWCKPRQLATLSTVQAPKSTR